MILTLAAALANALNFIIFAMIATWYVAPWLATRQRAEALAPLLWVQAFRHIAFCRFSQPSNSVSRSPTAPEIRLLRVT